MPKEEPAYPKVLTGEEAVEAFDADQYREEMRKKVAQRLLEVLLWLEHEHDKEGSK